MASQRSDRELVEAFRAGDLESYEELISRYSEKAFSLASRMCRDQEDAEEVLQDVFVSVFRKLDKFEGKSSFSSWIYRVTVNAALMKLRKKRQERSVPLDLDSSESDHLTVLKTSEIEQGDHLTLRAEIAEVLEEAIQRLPEEYRPVFILRDVDGLTSGEVGKILGISIPAVKSRLHRSRVMLRRKLKSFYQEFTTSDGDRSVGNG